MIRFLKSAVSIGNKYSFIHGTKAGFPHRIYALVKELVSSTSSNNFN
jgi:hypothetical protein